MKEYKIPHKTLTLWRIRTVAIWILISLLFRFYTFSFKMFFTIFCILTLILFLVIFFYLPKFFKECTVKYTKGSVIINKGVIFKNSHILPFSRLIYTQTITSPFARMFNLSAITLKAARSHIIVPEMEKKDAEELIAAITKGEEND